MPFQKCKVGKKKGIRWGKRGKCYTGKAGLKKAFAQAYAIYKNGGGEKPTFPK